MRGVTGATHFVESERMWTPHDIATNQDNLLLLSYDSSPKRRDLITQLATDWIQKRKSPPKCLVCASGFRITKIETDTVTKHPSGDGMIIISSCGTLGGGPPVTPPVYFDPDGKRVEQSNAG